MKIVFFQLNHLEKYKNIKIIFHQPKTLTKVIDLDSLHLEDSNPGNFSIFRNLKSKIIYLYYSTNTMNPFLSKTSLLISQDALNFKPSDLDMSLKAFSSNMVTFIDHNSSSKELYKAIGGCHLSQWHFKELGQKEDLENIGNISMINLKSLFDFKNSEMIYQLPHPAFIKRKKLISKKQKQIYDNDTESMFKFLDPTHSDLKYYGNGLYLYSSEDGHNWKLKYNLPLISGMKEGHYDYLYFCSTFQSQPNCFYDPFNKKYLLYLRSNLNGGLKHMQVTKSSNMIEWEPLKFVNFNPTFDLLNDNYESLNPMVYPDIYTKYPLYISFPVFYSKKPKNKEDSFIGLGFSDDALNWKIHRDLIKLGLTFTKDQPSSTLVNGLIISDDNQEFYIYEHRNKSKNIKNIKNQTNSIWRHSFRIDGLSSISAGSLAGFMQTRMIIFNNQIQLNYHTKLNGYLHIELMNFEEEIVSNQKDIKGDSVNYTIDVPPKLHHKKGYIRITLKDAELYAISV